MTKEELVEYYKTLSDDDKKHFDNMFVLDKIDCGIKSVNPNVHNIYKPLFLQHFKRETEKITISNQTVYIYKLLYVSTHSETKELLVNYEAMYEDETKGIKLYHICSRPIEMFMSKVDTNKYPNIKQKYRFELVASNGIKDDVLDFCKAE